MLWDHGHPDCLVLLVHHLVLSRVGVDVFADLALWLLGLLLLRLLGLLTRLLLHCLRGLGGGGVGGQCVKEAGEGGRGEEHAGEV